MSVDLLTEAHRRIEAGDPQSARRLAERALDLSRRSGPVTHVAACAQLLGECLYVTGDVDGARSLAEEAIRLDEADGNPTGLAADLNLLGVIELTVGRAAEGLGLIQRSLDLRTAALGPDDEETIESLNNVGVGQWRSGARDEAIATHEEALRRCERALGDHRRTAETLNALAVKLQSIPETNARARPLYERALVVADRALGPDAELVARLLANVATARLADEETDGVGKLLDRSLDLHERHFGPSSRWTANVLQAIGDFAWLEGRYGDAQAAFERSFVIRMNELGPNDDDTLQAALRLATVLSAMGPDAMHEATALYLPVMALEPDGDMGGLPRSALPAPQQAVDQLRQIAARLEARLRTDPAQAAAIARAGELAAEADARYLAGELGPAADRLKEAMALLEVARGPHDPSLVELLHRLKLVHRVSGTESAVMPILERIHVILEDAYGENHPLTIRALGEIYWQQRREFGPAGGRETAERLEQQVQDALGEGSPAAEFVMQALEAARQEAGEVAEPYPEALSSRRERIMAAPAPLADELLSDLDAVPWRSLDHAYGHAVDTPRHLRLLLADDDGVRQDALDLLAGSLLAEGSVYPATVPALRAVRRLAGDPRVPRRDRLIPLLVGGVLGVRIAEGPAADELRAALADLPTLLRYLVSSDADPAVREAAVSALAELGS